jgi:Kef-type K+ transport system membrane component KefB/nucleotide-binding universal stress UspA family protein
MTQPFTAASHHDILLLLTQVAVLLFTARLFGEIAQRFKQPTVVGEILAGIILGPSLLSGFVPWIESWLIPHTSVQGYLLEVISLLGAMFLLLITGLETDLTLIRRHARTAIGVSLGGIIFTFSSGFILGQFLPDDLLAAPDRRLVFALFVATAMSISAIPVIAKVLMDLDLIRRDIGQTIIAAGMSDDTIGWILLSIVAGLATGEAVTVGSLFQSIGSVLAFMVVSFTAGRWLVKRLLDFVQNEISSRDRILSLVVILMFVWGAITQFLNLEAVLGAFVIGILFGTMPNLPEEVVAKLESIALGIFAPIFFAVAGLKVNVLNLLEPRLLLVALLVIFVATTGKVIGTYAGARVVGRRNHWTSLSFGAGLNARGAMEIIIATIGLSLGILTQDMFSIIVLMAMTTSLMAPAALRWVLKRVEPEAQELERLKHEAILKDSLIPNVHRVLLPVRLRENTQGDSIQTVEARLMDRLGQNNDLALTLLSITSQNNREQITKYLNSLEKFFQQIEVTKKIVESNNPSQAILDEVKKDYDLLVMGATQDVKPGGTLFTPLVDSVVRMSPTPSIVVHGSRVIEDWSPRRILVPTNGTWAARRAAELAFGLANKPGEEVIILHIIEQNQGEYHLDLGGKLLERQYVIAHQIVEDLRTLGESMGANTLSEVRTGASLENVILDAAKNLEIDLVILGTDLRAGSDHLYLGPKVERVLSMAPCPVIVLNTV